MRNFCAKKGLDMSDNNNKSAAFAIMAKSAEKMMAKAPIKGFELARQLLAAEQLVEKGDALLSLMGARIAQVAAADAARHAREEAEGRGAEARTEALHALEVRERTFRLERDVEAELEARQRRVASKNGVKAPTP